MGDELFFIFDIYITYNLNKLTINYNKLIIVRIHYV